MFNFSKISFCFWQNLSHWVGTTLGAAFLVSCTGFVSEQWPTSCQNVTFYCFCRFFYPPSKKWNQSVSDKETGKASTALTLGTQFWLQLFGASGHYNFGVPELTGSHKNGCGAKEKYLERTSDNVKYILGGSHWTEIRCWERPPPSWGPRRDQLANSELWSSRAFPLRLEPVRPFTHLLVLLPPPQQGIP